MSFADNWVSLQDTDQLSAADQVRVHLAVKCPIFSGMDTSSIQANFSTQQAIAAVLSVDEDLSDWVTNFYSDAYGYTVTVSVPDGTSAGDIRAAAYNALNATNQQKMISCPNLTVGPIEKRGSSCNPLSLATGQASGTCQFGSAFVIGAIAVAALALLIFYKDLRQTF